jgi:hypothetical protein
MRAKQAAMVSPRNWSRCSGSRSGGDLIGRGGKELTDETVGDERRRLRDAVIHA